MDLEEKDRDANGNDDDGFEEAQEDVERPRELPSDLPRSLDDRQNFRSYNEETEYYDAWQGQSQFLTAPTIAKPLNFNLALHEPDDDDAFGREFGNDDARVAQMLAAQARKAEVDTGEVEEDEVLNNAKLSRDQKKAVRIPMGIRLPDFQDTYLGLGTCAVASCYFIHLRYALTLLSITFRHYKTFYSWLRATVIISGSTDLFEARRRILWTSMQSMVSIRMRKRLLASQTFICVSDAMFVLYTALFFWDVR